MITLKDNSTDTKISASDESTLNGILNEVKHLSEALNEIQQTFNDQNQHLNPEKVEEYNYENYEYDYEEEIVHEEVLNSAKLQKTGNVICFFSSWAWYKPSDGKFFPEDIDPSLCTHIIYSFALLDNETLLMKSSDEWTDIDNKFYHRVTHLKYTSKAKIILALGGWMDSSSDKYYRLMRDSKAREKFISHCIEYLERYGFQGLDLDYEYVGCWQGDCTQGKSDEKFFFIEFVKELSAAFAPRGLSLSASVPTNEIILKKGYDIPALSKYLDFINLMTYDMAGAWSGKTAHHSSISHHKGDEVSLNSEWVIQYWIQHGAAPEKLMLGIPMYGIGFTLRDPDMHYLHAPILGSGKAGDFTQSEGTLAFYEICNRTLFQNWKTYQDPKMKMGPYSWNEDQWVGYDSPLSVQRKTKLISEYGLGGAMVW